MSYDRALEHTCQHLVQEEALFLNSDYRTVQPLRPIASSQSVVVRINGLVDVPSSGLYAPARVVGKITEPFTITPGVNDTLVVKIGEADPVTLTVPGGKHIDAAHLAAHLNRLPDLHIVATKGHIGFKTRQQGPGASFMFLAGSTLAETLGLSTGRLWRGRTIYPGWSLVTDVTTLPDRPFRLVVFDEPLKGYFDYVELNYTTIQQECRRCHGLGVEHDFRYDGHGNVRVLRDSNLLLQEILKMTYTIQGSNVFHTWYGTSLVEMIGTKLVNSGLVQTTITADIQQSFRRWQSIKTQQENTVGQYVSDGEFPYRLLGVNVRQGIQDPTVMYVTMTIQNRETHTIEITRGIPVNPEQGALRGVSGLVLAE